jgi:Na+-driven multidrug efflux pump
MQQIRPDLDVYRFQIQAYQTFIPTLGTCGIAFFAISLIQLNSLQADDPTTFPLIITTYCIPFVFGIPFTYLYTNYLTVLRDAQRAGTPAIDPTRVEVINVQIQPG